MAHTHADNISTSAYYKDTDLPNIPRCHSYHPASCKNSIPYAKCNRLRRICFDETHFHEMSKEQVQFLYNQPSGHRTLDQLPYSVEIRSLRCFKLIFQHVVPPWKVILKTSSKQRTFKSKINLDIPFSNINIKAQM